MSLDDTTLDTLAHLEARLVRIEHLLYGHTAPPAAAKTSAIASLEQLERRFAALLQDREKSAYREALKIYHAHPAIFDEPRSTEPEPPATLPPAAVREMVLAAAPSYPATASALTSIADTPVPDPALSAALVALGPRMRGIETTQRAQAAEIADLRRRSETLVREWYERGVVGYAHFVAGVEGRVERAEAAARRAEKAREEV